MSGHRPCVIRRPLHVTALQTALLLPWMVTHSSLHQAVIASVSPKHHPLWCNFLRILFVPLSGNTESLTLSFYPKCHSLPFLSTWWCPKYSEVALMTFINIHCWLWLTTCFVDVKSVYVSPFAGLWCWALFSVLFEATESLENSLPSLSVSTMLLVQLLASLTILSPFPFSMWLPLLAVLFMSGKWFSQSQTL